MIYEGWYGVINKKGELMCVEESEYIAAGNSLALEIHPNSPTNRIVPVTILSVPLLDFVLQIVDAAQATLSDIQTQELVDKITKSKETRKDL